MEFAAGVDQQEGPDHAAARRADDNPCDHQPILRWVFFVEKFEFFEHAMVFLTKNRGTALVFLAVPRY